MEFLQNIGIDQFADIGFGILVAGICLKTLFTDKNALNRQREIWKEEFHQLESSLKELITEASDASEIFDKKIARRQNEIKVLLEKTEKSIKQINIQDLQNSASQKNGTQTLSESLEVTEKVDPPWALEIPIQVEESIKKTQKGASLRYKTLSCLGNISNNATEPKLTLKDEIQIEKEEQEKADTFIFQQTSIVDPVSFKIAKRLLLEGKELHIVARKLELPVSEIRHLDTLLREQAQKKNQPLPKVLAEKEIRRVRGIVRDPLEKSDETNLVSSNSHSLNKKKEAEHIQNKSGELF
jgi:hypothetical protein